MELWDTVIDTVYKIAWSYGQLAGTASTRTSAWVRTDGLHEVVVHLDVEQVDARV